MDPSTQRGANEKSGKCGTVRNLEAANGFKLKISSMLGQNPTLYMLIIQTQKVYTS